jgi:O-antigen/teichoic acid export membrane protein
MTVGRRALRGTLWLSAANYAAYAVTFVADILLARLLFPEDFGTVALAVSVLAIVGQLSSLGLGAIVVQYKTGNKAQERRFLSTVFAIQLIVAASIPVVVLLLSAVLRWIYDPAVIVTLILLAAGRSVQILNQIPSSLMQKRMMFRQDALISFLSLAVSSALGVFLAWQGFGPWSLVAKRLSQIAISGVGVWWVVRWRPELSWDDKIVRYVWRFARSMWVSGNLQVVLKELDDTAVGTVGDTEVLGYYSRAYKLSRLFIEFVAPAIARTSLPAYSSLKDDSKALSSVFTIVQRFLARMAALFYLEVGLLAPTVVAMLYGERWLSVVPLFRLMVIYAFLQPLFNQHALLLVASERPHVLVRVRVVQAALFAPGVFIAAYLWGAVGVAVVVDVMILVGIVLIVRRTRELVQFSFTQTVFPSILGGLVTIAVFWMLQLHWQPGAYWTALVVFAPFIVLVFVVCLLVCEGRTLFKDIQRVRRGLFKAQPV